MEARHPFRRRILAPFVASLLGVLATTLTAEPSRRLVAGRVEFSGDPKSNAVFGLGAARGLVIDVAGLPDATATDDIWIYFRCGSTRAEPGLQGLDTLVVAFAQDRVVAIRMTEYDALLTLVNRRGLRLQGPPMPAFPAGLELDEPSIESLGEP